MANRIARRRPLRSPDSDERAVDEKSSGGENQGLVRPEQAGPLAVLTEGLWKREALALRALEKGMLAGVERWILKPQEAAWRDALQHRFVKPEPVVEEPPKQIWLQRLWGRLQK